MKFILDISHGLVILRLKHTKTKVRILGKISIKTFSQGKISFKTFTLGKIRI